MPCPSEIHLRLMAKVMHKTDRDNYPKDDEIRLRVKEFGPYTRTAIVWNEKKLVFHRAATTKDLDKICRISYFEFINAVNAGEHVLTDKTSLISGFSFRFARIDCNRYYQEDNAPYRLKLYKSCSEVTNAMITRKIREIPVDKIRYSLLNYQEGLFAGNNDDWLLRYKFTF
jgi:hypothetical protein